MLKHIYNGIFGVLLIGFAACSTEQFEDHGLTPGTTPILLTGAVTRASGTNGNLDGYAGLYLSAKIDVNTNYLTNNAITIGSGDANKSVLDVDMNYPLDKEKMISFYGHSGEVADEKIGLTSGTAATNDALISNGTDGTGTDGSANNPVSMLTFRHVMTKVTVKIEVDGSLEDTKPTNIQIGFDDSKVAASGKYALAATANETATDISGNYTLKGSADANGTDNYLVPTGETLSGTAGFIQSLMIDDYTATPQDLTNLTIPQADLNGAKSDLVLKPGLAYTLTFKINRLKVVGITLAMKEWDIIAGNADWGYDPYKVKMNVSGGYSNSGDNLISKIVLHYTPDNQNETYQYIGSGAADGSDAYAHFVTLPKTDKMTDGTLKADLYTRNGLLIVGHEVKYESADASFGINLGSNGMIVKDGYHQVSTPLQFYNMMSNPEENTKYLLIENIDINSLPLDITPKDFPIGAELDGNGKSILHLRLKGSGLFRTNNGTLKNIHNAFCSIDATETSDTYVGGLCSINNGTIEGCINEANLKTKYGQIAGGVCGQNNTSGKILACLSTGNIPAGERIGGICGENANPTANAITACISTGMLHESSNHQVGSNIGGICGYQSVAKTSGAVINTCFWLTGTSRPAQGSSDENAIGGFNSSISPTEGYCLNTTNMTETLLRTEAVDKLNNALTSTEWLFEWQIESDGTCKTVWPMPVKKTTTP